METEPLSRYRNDLPAYLHSDLFLGRFLLAFEKMLSGLPEEETAPFQPQLFTGAGAPLWGLETIIANIHTYLDPQQTPSEFLPWLASWVALSLREDWDDKVKRQFISQIVPLYQIRGTIRGLKKMLQIYLESSGLSYPERTISVFEFDDHPHYFQVQLALPSNQVIQPDRYWRECRAAKAIIDHEKPAHTFYALRILTLTMQITKAWGCCYPFTLFEQPPQQIVQIEATVKLTAIDSPTLEAELARQILIRIQGKHQVLEPKGSQMGATVRQTVFYDQLLANPDGYFVALANLSDRALQGILTVTLHFNLNGHHYTPVVFEAPFDLNPTLRIYRPLNQLEAMPGNTRLAADPQQTLRLQTEPPLTIYEPRITPIDGNTRLGPQIGQTMRLVHDARLRIYLPRPRYDRMEGSTRLGSEMRQTLQLPRDRQNPRLKIYQYTEEYKVGNTRLGTEVGHTMRLATTSQWEERLYRFRLFEPPVTRMMEIEAWIQPRVDNPAEFEKIMRLLVVRMQSCTAAYSPFTPELEFLDTGICAKHHFPYERFLANPKGFYVVITNINDRPVAGKITIKLNFMLNKQPLSLVIHEEDFYLSPRDHVLEICHPNQYGEMQGNTILGRLTPFNLRQLTVGEEEDDWID